jgi:phage terminase large subunit-like protein
VTLSQEDTSKLQQYQNLMTGFIKTWDWNIFIRLPHTIIACFTGNQRGKTAQCARSYVMRIMGIHPVPYRNVVYMRCPNYEEHEWWNIKFREEPITIPWYQKGMYLIGDCLDRNDFTCQECGEKLEIPKRESRIFRFCSENLPGEKETTGEGADGQSAEIRNATYPEFKKWLPPFLIKKDITVRKPSISLSDPWAGQKFGDIDYQGEDIIVEFVSYSQMVQATAGIQRFAIWFDEEPPYDFYEEQIPRLLKENQEFGGGDICMSLTPANKITWTYDELYERAALYVRTQAICDFLKDDKVTPKRIETTDSVYDIAVIQAATDDNPSLSTEVINKKFIYDDPFTIATRRYGIFAQTVGRIFSNFSWAVHVIDPSEYFSDGKIE